MSDWVQSVSSGLVGILGTGGIMAWRNSRTDAGKLALEIAKEADKKAQTAIDRLDEMHRRVIAHSPWDLQATHEIRKLGGIIADPPPLL